MYQVIKRDGKITEFDLKKITRAIEKAFISLKKEYHPSVIDMLALKVTSDFEKKIKDHKIAVEDIQAYEEGLYTFLDRISYHRQVIVMWRSLIFFIVNRERK